MVDPSTITAYKALNASVREEAAKDLGPEHRAAAEEKGLKNGTWLLHAWVWPTGHKATTYAIRGPNGEIYTSLLDAQDAHDGKVKVTMVCQRPQASGEICGKAKEMYPGSNTICGTKCKGNNTKGRAPTVAQINLGQATKHWKALTEDDNVDESAIQVSASLQQYYYSLLMTLTYSILILRNAMQKGPSLKQILNSLQKKKLVYRHSLPRMHLTIQSFQINKRNLCMKTK